MLGLDSPINDPRRHPLLPLAVVHRAEDIEVLNPTNEHLGSRVRKLPAFVNQLYWHCIVDLQEILPAFDGKSEARRLYFSDP
jgi:hypothetical protein